MKKVRMGIYVSEEVRTLAHKLRDETGRSISHVMEASIREWAREIERERNGGVVVKMRPVEDPEFWEKVEKRVEGKIEEVLKRETLKRAVYV